MTTAGRKESGSPKEVITVAVVIKTSRRVEGGCRHHMHHVIDVPPLLLSG